MKSERVTLLTTPEFKHFLEQQARADGVSVAELVRIRCGQPNEDEHLLTQLLSQLRRQVGEAREALQKANKKADLVLADLAKRRKT